MTDLSEPAPFPRSPTYPDRMTDATLIGVALVVLADQLVFRQAPGLGLLVFVLAIGIGVLLVWRRNLAGWRSFAAVAVLVGSALPLFEANTLLGVVSASVGLIALALTLARQAPRTWTGWPLAFLLFIVRVPLALLSDGLRWVANRSGTGLVRTLIRGVIVWLVPLLCAAVFVFMFAAANPLIENTLARIDLFSWLERAEPGRLMFWAFVAWLIWPLLLPRLAQPWAVRQARPAGSARTPSAPGENLLFGAAAILRSLIVFNLIFAVQTLLDLAFLWGGQALPDGMTYAAYAHRGAYPLIVTALLAAAFVLAAMRKGGPGEASTPIRMLVYAFILQNVLLVFSSILRLDRYVEIYSLTELRIAAGIWMGLVAFGLLSILVRIALSKSNTWLIATNFAGLAATLFACAFVNFADVIARYNVEHSPELGGVGVPIDIRYMSELGPEIIPALDIYLDRAPEADEVRHLRDHLAVRFADAARERDWRDWSWRGARLADYLVRHPPTTSGERSDMYDSFMD